MLMKSSWFQVLYNILDWPTKPNSKLVVIGILLAFTCWIIIAFIQQAVVFLLSDAGNKIRNSYLKKNDVDYVCC